MSSQFQTLSEPAISLFLELCGAVFLICRFTRCLIISCTAVEGWERHSSRGQRDYSAANSCLEHRSRGPNSFAPTGTCRHRGTCSHSARHTHMKNKNLFQKMSMAVMHRESTPTSYYQQACSDILTLTFLFITPIISVQGLVSSTQSLHAGILPAIHILGVYFLGTLAEC